MLNINFVKIYIGKGVGIVIDELIFSARERVLICSPWISIFYAKKLSELAKKGVKIKLIIMDDESNKSAISIIKKTSIECRAVKPKFGILHAKIYAIDGRHAICGSINLTDSGMKNNIESLILFNEVDVVKRIEEGFMKLWDELRIEKRKSIISLIYEFLKKMIKKKTIKI